MEPINKGPTEDPAKETASDVPRSKIPSIIGTDAPEPTTTGDALTEIT